MNVGRTTLRTQTTVKKSYLVHTVRPGGGGGATHLNLICARGLKQTQTTHLMFGCVCLFVFRHR
jgi:hypothetical protein